MDIEHVAFNVADPQAMARWYVEHLHMNILRQLSEAPFTHFLADRSGKAVLEIYGHTKAAVPDYAAFDPLVVHIAFKVDDVAASRTRLADSTKLED